MTSLRRAVWSFWPKPYQGSYGWAWSSAKHHLLAWVLSVETARQHYPEAVLSTDDAGARVLVDEIGLPFAQVSTGLNVLHDADPHWWVLSKLHTYSEQREPFVHIDTDVFLWQPLPERMTTAPVLAQNLEYFDFEAESWYRARQCATALRQGEGWAPEEWRWYVGRRSGQAVCCGIVGGTCVGFFRHYADVAIQLITHPRNQPIWRGMGMLIGDNVLFEQYLLSACIDYHRQVEGAAYPDVDLACLFSSPEEAFSPGAGRSAGYTHLIGGAKRNQELMERLERRVERDYPQSYERCLRYLRDHAQEELIV